MLAFDQLHDTKLEGIMSQRYAIFIRFFEFVLQMSQVCGITLF